MAKEIYITGAITPETLKNNEKVQDTDGMYSFLDLINDIGEDTEGTIFINSNGGEVEEGLKMYRHLKGLNFNTVAIKAHSIASIIFLAGKKRTIEKNAQMLIHRAWVKGKEFENLRLNADILLELTDSFNQIDSELVEIYAKETGVDESKILALMSAETDIANQAIELGFASGYYEGTEKERPQQAENAYLMYNLKSIEMAENERITKIESLLSKVLNFFKAKAMVEKLADGSEIFIFSEDGEYAGKKAVIAVDGEPTETPAPIGTHKISDGREIVVGENGVISEVKEAENQEDLMAQITALKAENEALKASKTEISANFEALKNEKEDLKKEYNAKYEGVVSQLQALKEEVIGDVEYIPAPKKMTQEEFKKLSFTERTKIKLMARAER
jgi:ATP-dependent protease ClpP protease subunit